VEPSRFFNFRLLQIIVRGQILSDDGKTKINIKFRLGWYTLFVTLAMFLGTFGMMAVTILDGHLKDILNLTIWILVFPVLWTILLNRKLNKVEKKIEDLFGRSEANEPQQL
jgi:hypothetical protein